MKKRFRIRGRLSIAVYVLILISIQLPWFIVGGKKYNIYQIYVLSMKGLTGLSESAQEIWEGLFTGDGSEIIHILMKCYFVLIVIYEIVCLIYIVTKLCKKSWRMNIVALYISSLLVCMGFFSVGFICDNVFAILYPAILLLVGFAEFFTGRILEERE